MFPRFPTAVQSESSPLGCRLPLLCSLSSFMVKLPQIVSVFLPSHSRLKPQRLGFEVSSSRRNCPRQAPCVPGTAGFGSRWCPPTAWLLLPRLHTALLLLPPLRCPLLSGGAASLPHSPTSTAAAQRQPALRHPCSRAPQTQRLTPPSQLPNTCGCWGPTPTLSNLGPLCPPSSAPRGLCTPHPGSPQMPRTELSASTLLPNLLALPLPSNSKAEISQSCPTSSPPLTSKQLQ